MKFSFALSILASRYTLIAYDRDWDNRFLTFTFCLCFYFSSKKLVPWLRLIFRCHTLLELYYQSWSYVAKTGFDDSFKSLEKLSQFKFELPVDLAVRQFQNIKDAF
ncbi:RUN domain-containing protein 1 [Blattella germanica]|nr:RUN domain-containing protein 1 [Blattella germanica]